MTRLNWGSVTKKEQVKRRQAQYEKHRLEEEIAKTKIKTAARIAAIQATMKPAASSPVSGPTNQLNITSMPELITPEMATKWLEGHTHNRALTHAKAVAYAKDMEDGKWDLNGETLIFDWDGTLQDGQHRLWACIEANAAFWTMVTRGVDPATFVTIDTGKSRNAGDVLSIEKIPSYTTVAAAARIAMGYWRGEPRKNNRYANREILAFVRANPDLVTWVGKARTAPALTPVTSHLSALLFIAAQTYQDQADVFLRQFKTGENLTVGSPILTIRNRIFTEKGLRSSEKFELVVRAWNAFIENRILLKAVLSAQGVFPKIKGDLRN